MTTVTVVINVLLSEPLVTFTVSLCAFYFCRIFGKPFALMHCVYVFIQNFSFWKWTKPSASEGLMFSNIRHYLETGFIHKIIHLDVFAHRWSKYFNTLNCEHVGSETWVLSTWRSGSTPKKCWSRSKTWRDVVSLPRTMVLPILMSRLPPFWASIKNALIQFIDNR